MLKRGDSGTNVIALQNALNARTIFPPGVAKLVADGQFGPGTESIVKLYQAQNGIVVSGIADPSTIAKLGVTLAPSTPARVGPAGSVINSHGTTIPVAASSGLMDKLKNTNPLVLVGGAVALVGTVLFATMPDAGADLVGVKNNPKKKIQKRK